MAQNDRENDFRWRAPPPAQPNAFARVSGATGAIGVGLLALWLLAPTPNKPRSALAQSAPIEASITATSPPSRDERSRTALLSTSEATEQSVVVPAIRKPVKTRATATTSSAFPPNSEATSQIQAHEAAKPVLHGKAGDDDNGPQRSKKRRTRDARHAPVLSRERPEWRERAFGEMREPRRRGWRTYEDREVVWERRPRWPFIGFGMY